MTTFNEREKSFEKKFAMDEEARFKADARRNRLLAHWVAGKLGLTGTEVDDYVKAVRKADLASKGDEDVFVKIKKDFEEKGVAIATRSCARPALLLAQATGHPGREQAKAETAGQAGLSDAASIAAGPHSLLRPRLTWRVRPLPAAKTIEAAAGATGAKETPYQVA
jgi:hypothetical protein